MEKTGVEVYANDASDFSRRASVDIKEPRQIMKSNPTQHQTRKSKTTRQLQIKSQEIKEPNRTTVPSRNKTKAQPATSRRQPEDKQNLHRSSRMTPRVYRAQNQDEPHSEQNNVSPPQEQEALPKKVQHKQGPTQSQVAGPGQRRGDVPTPEKKINSGSPQQTFPTRREATMAFMLHIQSFAQEFSESPPRSERQFIWSFLDGIPDQAWAEFVQKKLLEAYPTSVRPSLGIRAKHPINFDSGLAWRHVLELLRGMQQNAGAAPRRL